MVTKKIIVNRQLQRMSPLKKFSVFKVLYFCLRDRNKLILI